LALSISVRVYTKIGNRIRWLNDCIIYSNLGYKVL